MAREGESYLVFIEKSGKNSGGRNVSKYKCICGNYILVPQYRVNSLHTKSCGCKSKELVSKKNSTHGLSKHPLFNVWAGIISRCYCSYNTSYLDYGGKGVVVCDEWRYNFKAFYDWCMSNGWKRGLQIDKDIIPKQIGVPALLYSPDMCKIVTHRVNCNNRHNHVLVNYNGDIKNIAQLSQKYNIHPSALLHRVKSGWNIEDALHSPINRSANLRKPIMCIETGEVFDSVTEASKEKRLIRSKISSVLCGYRKTTGGLSFKFLN